MSKIIIFCIIILSWQEIFAKETIDYDTYCNKIIDFHTHLPVTASQDRSIRHQPYPSLINIKNNEIILNENPAIEKTVEMKEVDSKDKSAKEYIISPKNKKPTSNRNLRGPKRHIIFKDSEFLISVKKNEDGKISSLHFRPKDQGLKYGEDDDFIFEFAYSEKGICYPKRILRIPSKYRGPCTYFDVNLCKDLDELYSRKNESYQDHIKEIHKNGGSRYDNEKDKNIVDDWNSEMTTFSENHSSSFNPPLCLQPKQSKEKTLDKVFFEITHSKVHFDNKWQVVPSPWKIPSFYYDTLQCDPYGYQERFKNSFYNKYERSSFGKIYLDKKIFPSTIVKDQLKPNNFSK